VGDSMSLRQEYQKNKIYKINLKKQFVKEWLEENVIFINEKVDRKQIKRLINLMVRFDKKFGPVRERLPGIKSIIDDAESNLQLVLSGKLTNDKISDVFQRLSLIYSILSDFFSNDLSVIMQTPAFKIPKNKPDTRLDSITEAGFDPSVITDTFMVALTPSEEEELVLNKLYKNIKMPQLDRQSIAKQMLGLCYNDLSKLSSVEKVPMAVTIPVVSTDSNMENNSEV
jgi:hypothetical protein